MTVKAKSAAKGRSAAQPVVQVGELWRFSSEDLLRQAAFEETREVTAVTAERIVCRIESSDPKFAPGLAEYSREWNLLSRPALGAKGDTPQDSGRWLWTPHYPHFSFPLAAGKQWSGTATVANSVTDTRNVHTYRAQVLPAQRVTVPAGRYETLPVRFESRVRSDDGQVQLDWNNVETLFYAPRARLFVRYEHRITGPDERPVRDALTLLRAHRPAR